VSLSIEIRWPLLQASYATYAMRFGSAESAKSVRSPAPLHATDAFSRATRNGPVRELEVATRYVALGYARRGVSSSPHVVASSPTRHTVQCARLGTSFGLELTPRGRWEAGSAFPRKVQFTRSGELETFNAWSSRKPQPPNFWYISARGMRSLYEMAPASNMLDNNAPGQSCGARMPAASVQVWSPIPIQ
jgi:hypothetical protein